MNRRLIPLLLLLSLGGDPLPACAQSGKVENLAAPTDPALSAEFKQVLEDKGYRLTLDGSGLAEIWMRRSLPRRPTKDARGALYPQIADSSLVGVISFPQPTTDFRGESLKPGLYTLRYELIPNDGNHLGVSPNPDFLLLIPIASDPGPTATLKYDEVVDLSRKATGTRHPAPLSLTQAGATPSLAKDEEDHWVFSTKLKLESGEDVALGLIVKGTAAQ